MRGKREQARRKKLWHFCQLVLLVLGLFLFAFVVVMIITYWRFQSVPDMLIDKVLDLSGVEAAILGFIKIAKTIWGKPQEGEIHEPENYE